MKYWQLLFSEAWRDAWSLVVGRSVESVGAAAAVFALTLLYQWRRHHEDISAKIKGVVVATGCTAAVLVAAFLSYGLVLTPKRLIEELSRENKRLSSHETTAHTSNST